MQNTIIISILVITAIVCLLLYISNRHKYSSQQKQLESQISKLESVASAILNDNIRSYPRIKNINNLIGYLYSDKIITAEDKATLICKLQTLYHEAEVLSHKMNLIYIKPSSSIQTFISSFNNIEQNIKQHNDTIKEKRLKTYKQFFDTCLSYPLDKQQRQSIISEEENCLVVSSAGSGKTSSIVGKVKYLINCQNIQPEQILLISYTNKAAAELTERMNISGLRGYTFHKLAIEIIAKHNGQKPTICDNTDALFIQIYHSLLSDIKFRKSVIEYYTDLQIPETEEEKRKREQLETLAELKSTRIKCSVTDMDGNAIYVRSKQEENICYILTSLGVSFKYEEPYEHPVADEMHSQYKPDFSIYFDKGGETHRIYLEHFGTDEHNLVPIWFAEDMGISYEEANKKYNDGITWKKATHKKYNTTLITTSSADFRFFDVKNELKRKLTNSGVHINELSEEEVYNIMLPHDSKKEKAFIRLVVTFITLLKTSCKDISQIIGNTTARRDLFIIQNIFIPVYNRYTEILKQKGEIDFTDAIIQATAICNASPSLGYKHIIVDEFQDISIDRYKFLQALRKGTPQAKLYCVGDDWQSIYRFSGSDMNLFNQFSSYFGATEISKIETTYRFGEPLVSLSSNFIQRNSKQIRKSIHPFNPNSKTELSFYEYDRFNYCDIIRQIVEAIPSNNSIFLLGRYSFDDYYLSKTFTSTKEGSKFYYFINNRKIEFMTVHKSKGLEADYVIILQCNKDTFGFPSQISDDPVLNNVLTESEDFPYCEERRLFYVAITRAKVQTITLYDKYCPSVFVNEFLHPEKITEDSYLIHPNANKKWTRKADNFLITLYREGKSIKYISDKMGRSQTSVIMRLGKLGIK